MRKRHAVFTLLFALFLITGLYPIDCLALSLIAFCFPILLFLDTSLKKPVFYTLLWAAGLVYYGYGLSWITHFSVNTYILSFVTASLVFPLLFSILDLATFKINEKRIKILFLPFTGAFLYWFLSLSPLGGLILDVPFSVPFPLLGIISKTGFGGIVFLALAVQTLIALLLFNRKLFGSMLTLILFVGIIIFFQKQPEGDSSLSPNLGKTFALIQHNLPVDGEWNFDHPDEIKDQYRKLALKAAKQNPDLIIFPFYDFPGDIYREHDFFTQLAEETGSSILVSEHTPQFPDKTILGGGFFSGAFLYTKNGLESSYKAIRKPPFRGEIQEFSADKYQLMDTPLGRVGILLCYEDVYPDIARKAKKMGADYLITLSNPGQFTDTFMPYYHLKEDQMRAIETGLPLLRVSANGYSAHISKEGKIRQVTVLSKEEIIFDSLPKK